MLPRILLLFKGDISFLNLQGKKDHSRLERGDSSQLIQISKILNLVHKLYRYLNLGGIVLVLKYFHRATYKVSQ